MDVRCRTLPSVGEPVDNTALPIVSFNNFSRITGLYLDIHNTVGFDGYKRAHLTKPLTTTPCCIDVFR